MELARSLIAFVVLTIAPGVALAVLIRPSIRRQPILLAATAPAFSYALAYAATSALALVDAGPWPGLVVVNGLVVAAGSARVIWQRRNRPRPLDEESTRARPDRDAGSDHDRNSDLRLAHWLLASAILLGALLWIGPGRPSAPKNGDVQNHAHFVARIVHENSVDPAVVVAESSALSPGTTSFYPLTTHSTMAVASRAANLSIPDLLVVWPLGTAILAFPCGIFVLARRLMPDRAAVAGFASLAAVCTAEFPYFPMYWGGVPFLIGMSLVPGVIALVLEAVDSRESSLLGLAALAAAGTTFAHTSELAVMAVILGCLGAYDLISAHRSGSIRPVLRSWGTLTGICALLLAPTLSSMLRATSENSNIAATIDEGVFHALVRLLGGPTQPVMGLFALAGIALLVRQRGTLPLGRMGAILTSLAIFALLLVSTLLSGPVWEQLSAVTVPWYKTWWRLTYNLAILVPLFVGPAFEALRSLASRSLRLRPAAAVAVVAGVLVLTTALQAWEASVSTGVHRPMFLPAEVDLFHDLAERLDSDQRTVVSTSGPSGTVLNQGNDSSGWVYAIAGVPAFTGMHDFDNASEAADRRYLLRHLWEAGRNPRVQQLLAGWKLRYVVVGDTVYDDELAAITPEQLSNSDGFKLLDHRGSYWLFEIPTGRPAI